MKTIPLGAINRKTGEYIYPKVANKMDEYTCTECHKELIICQGNIRVHHFRHKIDSINPCQKYICPSESQIHKDAKLLLKTLLENNINLSIIRTCSCCKKNEEFELPEITNSSNIELEYRFEYNGQQIADVAYIDNKKIICIFEIFYTHKTKGENRPEPWFEIDALSLILISNDINVTSLKIHCIRCVKCEECIQQEKDNFEKKKNALDILYNWFHSGIEIQPFVYDYASFGGVEKNIKCKFTDEIFDLILYVEPEQKYTRYCIRLIYNSSNYYFVNEQEYGDNLIGIYYLDIDWILSQIVIPERIQYIACLDKYSDIEKYITCINCKHPSIPFWVKRLNVLSPNYKVIYIGGDCCNNNPETEYMNCERCNDLTPLCIMETNRLYKQILCKNCDIDLFSNGKIYFYVPFNEKDKAKKQGAIWDNKYKKWFFYNCNINIDVILKTWKRLW